MTFLTKKSFAALKASCFGCCSFPKGVARLGAFFTVVLKKSAQRLSACHFLKISKAKQNCIAVLCAFFFCVAAAFSQSVLYKPNFFNIWSDGGGSIYSWGGEVAANYFVWGEGGDARKKLGSAHYKLSFQKLTSTQEKLSFDANFFSLSIGYYWRFAGFDLEATHFGLSDFDFLYKKGDKSGRHREKFTQDSMKLDALKLSIPLFFNAPVGKVALDTFLSLGTGKSGDGDMYYFYGKFGVKDFINTGCAIFWSDEKYSLDPSCPLWEKNRKSSSIELNFSYTRANFNLLNNSNEGLGEACAHLFLAGVKGRAVALRRPKLLIEPGISFIAAIGDFDASVTSATQNYLFFPYKYFDAKGRANFFAFHAGVKSSLTLRRDQWIIGADYLLVGDFALDYKTKWLYKKSILYDGSAGSGKGGFFLPDWDYSSLFFLTMGYEHKFCFSKGKLRSDLSLAIKKTFLVPIKNALNTTSGASTPSSSPSSPSSSSSSINGNFVLSYLLSLFSVSLTWDFSHY